MKSSIWLRLFLFVTVFTFPAAIIAQTTQDRQETILDTASIETQVEEVIDIARVYNDHKIIHVTVANALKRNTLNAFKELRAEIADDKQTINRLGITIDTLNSQMATIQEDLNEAIETKQSILVLGTEINKTVYNSVMWFLLAALLTIIILLSLMYKRSHAVTAQTKKDLDELKESYEQYRTDSRERYEKMVVKHHNELKKYKDL